MKLIQVVDSLQYVKSNCYQHQLLIDLKRRYDHQVIELANIEALHGASEDTVLLSTVKIRNVYANLARYVKTFGNRKLYIYDQDCWESFIDIGTYVGGYDNVRNALTSAEFVVTSGWWANFIRSQNIPAHFCRMWMLPEYCDVGMRSVDREAGMHFKGLLHGFRQVGIEALRTKGLVVNVSSSTSYSEWMSWLRTKQAFFHDESNDWSIKSVLTQKECAVIKDVEIASQGCFVFRDAKATSEMSRYDADKIPCIITYSSYDDCVDRFNWLKSLSRDVTDEMIHTSVELVKSVGGWVDMKNILENKAQ